MSKDHFEQHVLKLPAAQRLRLIRYILDSMQSDDDESAGVQQKSSNRFNNSLGPTSQHSSASD